MVLSVVGNFTDDKPVHPMNASFSIVNNDEGKTISVKPVQLRKAPSPMVVTEN